MTSTIFENYPSTWGIIMLTLSDLKFYISFKLEIIKNKMNSFLQKINIYAIKKWAYKNYNHIYGVATLIGLFLTLFFYYFPNLSQNVDNPSHPKYTKIYSIPEKIIQHQNDLTFLGDYSIKNINEIANFLENISTLNKQYEKFIKGTIEYESILTKILNCYNTFLTEVEDLQLRCETSQRIYQERKDTSNFSGIYKSAADRCSKVINKYKLEARDYAIEIDKMKQISYDAKAASIAALRERENLLYQKKAIELSNHLYDNLLSASIKLTHSIKNLAQAKK